MLPCGRQTIESDDIQAVVDVLNGDMITTGPRVASFESAFADVVGTPHAVAVSSGTAALHAAMHAIGVGQNQTTQEQDEVIVPAISFVATANSVVYCGARPVFADVDPDTLCIDPADVARKITPNTKAIVAMDYGGQPCNYQALRELADQNRLKLIADSCHSLGASVEEQAVGSLADLTCFSLHPVKQITCGEGGMVTTKSREYSIAMKEFRNHGITTDHWQRHQRGTHQYAMQTLGFNYRLTDIQCALGESQLKKLSRFTDRRNEIARLYDSLLSECDFAKPLKVAPGRTHARHLYVVQWKGGSSCLTRDDVFSRMRAKGIGVNVHYQPIYQHPFYKQLLHADPEMALPDCPVADEAYKSILSLPIFPLMTDADVSLVVNELRELAQSNFANERIAA